MKFTLKALIILSVLVSMIACENTKTKKEESPVKTESNEALLKIDLDNGKRWIANKETTEGINNMIDLMDSFADSENIDAYKTLEDNLQSEFITIFKKCTMKGEAHNQLHNYLLPLKTKFEQLSSEDLNKSKMIVEELKKDLSLYKDYFE